MYYGNQDIRIEKQDIPRIGRDEILMKVHACGICGSDVMEWYRKDKVPLVLGHEVTGEIAEKGEDVEGFEFGQRICASHHVPCLTCRLCRQGLETACETLRSTNFYPGGFSQYLRLPGINVNRGVYKLYDSVSYHDGAFIEPLACVLRGQRRAGGAFCKTVLVIGCGISGLLHLELAKAMGAFRIIGTDISEFRRKAALRFGADHAFLAKDFSSEKLREANQGHLADMVILTTGAPAAIEQAFGSLEKGGALLLFAPADQGVKFNLDINKVFWKNDITVTTTYAGSPADHYQALELIAAKRINVADMVTHVLPLEKTQEGFALVQAGDSSIKVIIEPNN